MEFYFSFKNIYDATFLASYQKLSDLIPAQGSHRTTALSQNGRGWKAPLEII